MKQIYWTGTVPIQLTLRCIQNIILLLSLVLTCSVPLGYFYNGIKFYFLIKINTFPLVRRLLFIAIYRILFTVYQCTILYLTCFNISSFIMVDMRVGCISLPLFWMSYSSSLWLFHALSCKSWKYETSCWLVLIAYKYIYLPVAYSGYCFFFTYRLVDFRLIDLVKNAIYEELKEALSILV